MNPRALTVAALFVERFVLAFVFFCLAWAEFNKVQAFLASQLGNRVTFVLGIAYHALLLLVGGCTCLLLLVGRQTIVPPRELKAIVVPLVATFLNFFYFSIQWMPASLQANLSPPALQTPLAVTGLVCIIVGPLIALWGILYLGRSFGIFVAVRGIILKGPYRWVRHPMYQGWILLYLGLAFANFSAGYLIMVAIHICIVIYRARLEEAELAQHSEQYREYMRRTGFLFPKWRS